jgi:hypothetical protein
VKVNDVISTRIEVIDLKSDVSSDTHGISLLTKETFVLVFVGLERSIVEVLNNT